MTLIGIDVSNNNGRHSLHNEIVWDAARVGLDFAIIKATQGISFVDPEYHYNSDQCGLPNGPYHWLEPAEAYGAPQEIVAQIKLLKSTVGTLANDRIIGVLDVENTPVGGGRRSGNPSPNDVALAIDVYEQEFGHTPMVYGGQPVLQPCARQRWEITRAKFWKAIYPGRNDGDPAVITRGYGSIDPWLSLTMWQWTSSGLVDGIHGRVDRNILYDPLAAILVGQPQTQGSRKMWSLKPPWAPTVGGQTDHYRVIDSGMGVAVLQGQGVCTVAEVTPDPTDPNCRWSEPLNAPIDQVTGFAHEDDWSILYVTFNDWHTFEFHTDRHGWTPPVAQKGDKGDKGDPGAPGAPGVFTSGPYRVEPWT